MKRILVADDDPQIVRSIEEMLSEYYVVDVSTTGLETLQKYTQHKHDGLITDIDFGPGISGLEVASLIRSCDKIIKILIFSAIDYSDDVRQQVVDIGAVFCEKPLTSDFVRRVLEG